MQGRGHHFDPHWYDISYQFLRRQNIVFQGDEFLEIVN